MKSKQYVMVDQWQRQQAMVRAAQTIKRVATFAAAFLAILAIYSVMQG